MVALTRILILLAGKQTIIRSISVFLLIVSWLVYTERYKYDNNNLPVCIHVAIGILIMLWGLEVPIWNS